jgi:hypothetical protein
MNASVPCPVSPGRFVQRLVARIRRSVLTGRRVDHGGGVRHRRRRWRRCRPPHPLDLGAGVVHPVVHPRHGTQWCWSRFDDTSGGTEHAKHDCGGAADAPVCGFLNRASQVRILPGARESPGRWWCLRVAGSFCPSSCPSFGWTADGLGSLRQRRHETRCGSTRRDEAGENVTHGLKNRHSKGRHVRIGQRIVDQSLHSGAAGGSPHPGGVDSAPRRSRTPRVHWSGSAGGL